MLMWGNKWAPLWISTRPAPPGLCGTIHQYKDADSYVDVCNAGVNCASWHCTRWCSRWVFIVLRFPRWAFYEQIHIWNEREVLASALQLSNTDEVVWATSVNTDPAVKPIFVFGNCTRDGDSDCKAGEKIKKWFWKSEGDKPLSCVNKASVTHRQLEV